MVQASPAGDENPQQELDIAKWVWSLLRTTINKLAREPADQIKGPAIDECFDWDPSYQMSERCQELGWIPAELRQRLDKIDQLLSQLSGDRSFWSDQAIITHPLWKQVRRVSRQAIPLMPQQPWATHGR